MDKNEAKAIREIALLLDADVDPASLEDIQSACVAGVNPYTVAQEIKRSRALSFSEDNPACEGSSGKPSPGLPNMDAKVPFKSNEC